MGRSVHRFIDDPIQLLVFVAIPDGKPAPAFPGMLLASVAVESKAEAGRAIAAGFLENGRFDQCAAMVAPDEAQT
jgi:hypothetical protein